MRISIAVSYKIPERRRTAIAKRSTGATTPAQIMPTHKGTAQPRPREGRNPWGTGSSSGQGTRHKARPGVRHRHSQGRLHGPQPARQQGAPTPARGGWPPGTPSGCFPFWSNEAPRAKEGNQPRPSASPGTGPPKQPGPVPPPTQHPSTSTRASLPFSGAFLRQITNSGKEGRKGKSKKEKKRVPIFYIVIIFLLYPTLPPKISIAKNLLFPISLTLWLLKNALPHAPRKIIT